MAGLKEFRYTKYENPCKNLTENYPENTGCKVGFMASVPGAHENINGIMYSNELQSIFATNLAVSTCEVRSM